MSKDELTASPTEYADWLAELKQRIHAAQQRATLAANREFVLLYWQIGQDILARQASQGWGSKVVDRLARESLKDPYRLDFLGLGKEAQERAIEDALVKHVTHSSAYRQDGRA